jgi:twitching motility protein PilJ
MALNVKELIGKLSSVFAGKAASSSDGANLGQVFGPIIGLLLFVLGAFFAIQQVRVNGPLFNQIKTADDLRADMLPPPLFMVEPYAKVQEIYIALQAGDSVRLAKSQKEIIKLEDGFNKSVEHWDSTEFPKELQGSYKAVAAAGKNFFNIYNNEFLPSVKAVDTTTALTGLISLERAYTVSHDVTNTMSIKLQDASNETTANTNSLLNYFLIGLGLLALLIAIAIYIFGKRQASATASAMRLLEEDGQKNQLAVLDLLDEMGDLSEGDLTVQAQVKENITGAIADSINYTIESLRSVVTEINRASEQVNTATGAAQSTSVALLEAAEMQSQQIADTTQAVNGMSTSIQQVATNANQAAQVAQRSLQAAAQGSQAVQNTIAGMNGIREQIQETSKRIKRLGESSQEIGEIVELISDITEQTNILALNAAIQAASAGEAGRGFTVVAEEVQRLAERSSEATKQISAIVKTIQTDTNSAVAAMEKSTEGVVEGAKLSDAAGQALTEIETVSNNLARLIQSISAATEAQTNAASQVTKNMQDIQEITSMTSQGTKQTAESVGQLTTLAAELRQSVAGFKLS